MNINKSVFVCRAEGAKTKGRSRVYPSGLEGRKVWKQNDDYTLFFFFSFYPPADG